MILRALEGKPLPIYGDGLYVCDGIHMVDRPGHDCRYAIDCGKTDRELDWRPRARSLSLPKISSAAPGC